jgi:hypothetical protein
LIAQKQVPCEQWSRVVGYFRPLTQWNPGKQEEFHDRRYPDGKKLVESMQRIKLETGAV